MGAALLHGVRHDGHHLVFSFQCRRLTVTTPSPARLVVETLADLPLTKGALIAETALLRQQLLVLQGAADSQNVCW